jgi:hypothetical protein
VQISLKLWTEDKHQKENIVPVSVSHIQGHGMSLYEYWKKHLSGCATNTPKFHASKGCCNRFKNRVKLHSIRSTGEITTANTQAALEFADM